MKRRSAIVGGIGLVVLVGALVALPVLPAPAQSKFMTPYSHTFTQTITSVKRCVTASISGDLYANTAAARSLTDLKYYRVTKVYLENANVTVDITALDGKTCTNRLAPVDSATIAQTVSQLRCNGDVLGMLSPDNRCPVDPNDASNTSGDTFDTGSHFSANNNGVTVDVRQQHVQLNDWPKTCIDVGAWVELNVRDGGGTISTGASWVGRNGAKACVAFSHT